MQGLDRHAQVLLGGTFNKVLFRSLRLDYPVVPPPLVDVVAAARSVTARHAPLLDQAILCDFMVDGHCWRSSGPADHGQPPQRTETGGDRPA